MKKAKALVMSLLLVVIMTAAALPTAAATVSENWAIAEEEGLAKASCNHIFQKLMNCTDYRTESKSHPYFLILTCYYTRTTATNWMECRLCGKIETKYGHLHGDSGHVCGMNSSGCEL